MDYKKYNNTKLFFGIFESILTFILIFLFVALGYSKRLENYLYNFILNDYLLLLVFIFVTGLAISIIFFPINFYTGFYLEHKYNLSNQTFWKWIWEGLKGLLIGILIGVPIILVFYYVIKNFGSLWWLPFAIFMFLTSVVLARIIPVFILPLFYKISSIEDEELKNRIEKLAADSGLMIQNVFKFNMSKNTKKANAAFTGIGKSKRILLADTLVEKFSTDEIETVLAHEFGHYKKKHILKNIIIGTVLSFFTLFIIAYLYDISLPIFNFTTRFEISALPLLSLWAMLISIIETPISSAISRKYEYEADAYAVTSTNKAEAFVNSLTKLTEQNLGDKDPHPFIEWFFYSHPSIKNRVKAIVYLTGKKNLDDILNSLYQSTINNQNKIGEVI
ncbi:MAG: M48 family metallopeptidase [Ignavibacterium sp.]